MQENEDRSPSSFMKRMVFLGIFLIITPLTLFTSVLSLVLITNSRISQKEEVLGSIASNEGPGVQIYAPLPSDVPSISGEIIAEDARPVIIENYLEKFNSPLAPYANLLVSVSDKYKLDFRLLAAIAMKESGLCKVIPEDTYNCWGWGIHSKGTLGFSSYEEGIETVSRGLKEKYVDDGLVTVEEIMGRYTPLSPNGAWAVGVTQYMEDMR